eukprot:7059428-Lingulodinium_polyedra.AAC.1
MCAAVRNWFCRFASACVRRCQNLGSAAGFVAHPVAAARANGAMSSRAPGTFATASGLARS